MQTDAKPKNTRFQSSSDAEPKITRLESSSFLNGRHIKKYFSAGPQVAMTSEARGWF